MYGIPFPPVRERQDRLEEALALICALFAAEGPVDFAGKHYRLEQAPFAPRTVQRPRPPIMVGGGGEQRTLRTLARYGDVMNVFGTPAVVKQKIAVLERHCRDIGRNPADIRKTIAASVIVSENEAFLERMRKLLGGGLSPDEATASLPIGDAAHVRGIIGQYADVGVTEVIMMSQGPWKRDVYERINEELVAPLN